MKRSFWGTINCVLTICLLIASLSFLTNLMERKASVIKYRPFFEQKADFDVLFMGTSHVINGVFPMELWNDYGIVSYNFGGHATSIPTTYWILKNALDYTNPKLVVVDCLRVDALTKTFGQDHIHISFDAFPLSKTKIAAVMDLADTNIFFEAIGKENNSASDEIASIGLLWNFSQYHFRWAELTAQDFTPNITKEKGAESRIAVALPDDTSQVDRSGRLEDNIGIEYLRKIIEDCQSQNIEVLLTYLPFPAGSVDWANANRVYDIAEEYDINYINFLDMDIVDFNTDCYDASSHLNPSGARKVTDYLGKYIMEHYKIPDQRGNPDYSDWFEDYENYKKMKTNNLQNQRSLDTYLMLLSDKNLDAVIEIINADIWSDNKFICLVKNLGVDMSNVSDATNCLMICRGGKQVEAVSLDRDADTKTDTVMGLLRISHDESEKYSVYLNDTACFIPSENENWNFRIYVRDSETLSTVGQAVF